MIRFLKEGFWTIEAKLSELSLFCLFQVFVSLNSDDEDEDDYDDQNDRILIVDDNGEMVDNFEENYDTADDHASDSPGTSNQSEKMKHPSIKIEPKCPPNSLEKYSSSDIENSSSGEFSLIYLN